MVAKRVVSSVIQRQVKFVQPVPVVGARGLVGEVYAQVEDEMKVVVPPILLHSPAPDVLAAYWTLTRETLASGRVDRVRKEAVASAVSVANICPYCVDMHTTGLYSLASERDAEAVVADRPDDVADPRIHDVVAWARVVHQPDEELVRRPPFPAAERPELIGVAVAYHYLNRMVNVFLPSFLVPRQFGQTARRRFKQGLSRVLAPTLRENHRPGRALALLSDAPLPDDARWATGNAAVSAAVARSYAALEAAGVRALAPSVRATVTERLDHWRGEEMGLSRDWCEQLVAGLPATERAAGRLALLTAFASYQVDEDVVRDFQRQQPGDPRLVEAVAWASFAAARHIGRMAARSE